MGTVTDTLSSYYNKTQVDELISNIDVSSQLEDVYEKINNIDGLAKFNVSYNSTSYTLSFFNGETKIKDANKKNVSISTMETGITSLLPAQHIRVSGYRIVMANSTILAQMARWLRMPGLSLLY